MLKNGGGSIVNTSSILGTVVTKNRAAYITAKHGVTGLSKAAALDYAQQNIRVNSIHPGYVETPLIRKVQTEETHIKHPIQRLGTVDEVANLVIFLLQIRLHLSLGQIMQLMVDIPRNNQLLPDTI